MMSQTRDRQHATPLHLRSDFVQFKAMLFVSDDYGTLRDCVETFVWSGATGSNRIRS
jgi:hypothetical protein